jgi:valyl-tRNA synthetase
MKHYFSLACAFLITIASFSQNANLVKAKKSPAPLQKSNTKQIVRKKTQSGTSNFSTPFIPQQKASPLLNIGHPFQTFVKTVAVKLDTLETIEIDTRDLKFSKNGLLLSPDGYEIEFRTSGNSNVTDICATPRPYIKNGGNKSPTCSFTVPCDDPLSRDAASTAIKYFQLRWHVITNGSPSDNIDQNMITAMMNTLNADYAIHNMVFCEDSAEWNDDFANYFHDSSTEEVSLKTAYNQRPADLINIYVVGDMTAGGYARFPYDPMGGPNFRGGIVLNRGNCNATGHTLAHEMGHTFGLEHTFAGVDERTQCSACYEQVRNANGSSNTSGAPSGFGAGGSEGDQEGDWCSDTNPHDTYSYNCSTSANSNGGCDVGPWNNAPVNNHMSYSFCSTQFTTQQRYRMHCMANSYLASWTAYGGAICGAQPPVADFSGTPTTWGSPSNVVFTDLSAPTAIINTWTWNFNNAGQTGTVVPATFVGQTPPTIVYTLPVGAVACQDYEVSLTITSPNGNDTETKTSYITVCPPAGDCDTLDTDYNNVGPTNTRYNGVNGLFTGVPNEGSVALTDPAGFYEMYFTPNAGTSIVGGVNVALGGLNDPDDDMTVQIAIYNDDGAGFPDIGGGPIVVQAYSPTTLGVPNGGFIPFWIPITNPNTPITTATFHVGVEIFPGDPTDSLYVISNIDGEGDGAAMTNFTTSTGCGLTDFNDPTGVYCPGAGYAPVDFDMWIIPMMGEYAPRPIATGFTETVTCDTTYVTITDTVLYHNYAGSALVGMSYTFLSDGTVINSSTPLGTISKTYTTAGPEIIMITAINDCGRADTTFWTIPYNFMPTPDADFTKTQPNDVCIGDVIDFTASTSGYQDYNWDFGDGTTASSGSSDTTTHTYLAAGTYYTSLTTTSTGYQPINVFYFEDFDTGIPATYNLFDGDGQPDNYGINGSWVPSDFNNDGDAEAVSSSWWNPAAPNPADDWLITPAIGVLPPNQMLSWIGEASDASFPDGYEVRISTTGALPANVANFSTVLFSTTGENAFPTTRGVSLAAYAGQTVYIAFVNNSNDMNILMIDDVWVGTTGPGCVATQNKVDFVVVIDCSIIPPTADMSVSDSTGCAPLTVTFTDNSTFVDPIDTWLWNFGDGTFYTTNGTPPPHLYTTPGTYFASLEVCNAGGCTTHNISIVVGTGITSNAGTDQDICGGTTATLAGNDPSPDTGQWALLTGGGIPTTPTAFGSAVTGLPVGLNQFTWTITGSGCVSVDTVDINVATPVMAGADSSLTTCSTAGTTDLFTLLVGAQAGGIWTPAMASGTGVFNPAVDAAATYQYYLPGTAPCGNDTADVVVILNTTDDPTFTYAAFCAGLGGVSGVPVTAGGTYSFNPDLLDGSTINAGTGAIANAVAGATYNVQYLTPSGPCRDSLTLTVNVNQAPIISNIIETCNAANTDYTVSFDVTGGSGGPYTVTENLPGAIGGSFTGSTWTSNLITAGVPYDFDIDDVNGCGPINVAGNKICICISDAGTMDVTPLDLCETDTAIATANGDHALDPNDYIMYVLHTNNTATLGIVLDTNVVAPSFNFSTPLLTYGTTYYISTVVGDSLGNYVDFSDGCLQVATGTPVTWEQSPNAGANDSLSLLCNSIGNSLNLNTLLTVPTGGTWAETTGSTQFTAATGVLEPTGLSTGHYAFTNTVNGTNCPNDVAFFGVTVNEQDNAGANNLTSTICNTVGSTLDLNTLLSGNTVSGTWAETTASNQFTVATGIFDANSLTAGSYTFIYYVTTAAPCGNDTANFTVTVGNCSLPVASFNTSTLTICSGDSITFTDNSTGINITNWNWTFPGGTPATANTQGSHSVIFNTPGTYNINLSITDSVGTNDTTIVITVTNCVSAAFTTSSNTICAGDSIIFTDGSTSTIGITFWQWNFDQASAGGVTPATGNNQGPNTVFYNTPGVYNVELIVSDGSVLDTINRTVTITDCSPIAQASINGAMPICETGCITFNDLSTGNPTTYSWTFPGGTPGSSTSANPGTICYDTAGTYGYSLIVTNQYGSDQFNDINTINIINCDPPVAGILMNDDNGEICLGDCISFTYNDSLGSVPDTLTWIFQGNPNDTIISTNPLQTFQICWIDTVGSFTVSVTASNQYGASTAIDTIQVHPNPIISAGNDVFVDFGSNAYIQSEINDAAGNILLPTGGSILWSPPTYLNSPNDLGSDVIEPLQTTVYTVTFVDSNGCTTSDNVTVNVNQEYNIGVPSAFTPASGYNNILFVKGKNAIKSMNFTIYNRYGQKVFETTDVNQGWDGTHNGKELNPGVFVYYVKVKFIDDTSGELKGNVTLIK